MKTLPVLNRDHFPDCTKFPEHFHFGTAMEGSHHCFSNVSQLWSGCCQSHG